MEYATAAVTTMTASTTTSTTRATMAAAATQKNHRDSDDRTRRGLDPSSSSRRRLRQRRLQQPTPHASLSWFSFSSHSGGSLAMSTKTKIARWPLTTLLLLLVVPWLFAEPALGIGVCRYNVCVPNCICDYQFDDMCAIEYGNFGWNVPPTAKEYVWRYMRPDPEIDYTEIKPVGMSKESQRMTGIGYANGRILDIRDDVVAAQVYFEVHPSHVSSNDIVVELYGGIEVGVGFSDCAESGTLLGRVKPRNGGGENLPMATSKISNGPVGLSAKAYPLPSYNDNYRDENAPVECHPRFQGAIVATADFEISNPFGGSSVWFPQENDANTGTLEYCVRVRVQPEGLPPMPNKDDRYHYIDTKFKIQGNRQGVNFANPNSIRIYTNQEFASKEAHVKANSVGIRAFLCGLPPTAEEEALVTTKAFNDEEVGGITLTSTRSFGIGQDFTICVGPDAESFDGYEVTGFSDVICENEGQRREIVKAGVPDAISVIDASTVGHLDYGEGNPVTIAHPGALGIRTTVTTGWTQLGNRTVTCMGMAKIREREIPLDHRNLRRRRGLQTADRKERGDLEIDFTMDVWINNSTVYTRGEVPYPEDENGGGRCEACKSTFLALFIIFLLGGGGGLAGWWWWNNHGRDMVDRHWKSYGMCGLVEDISKDFEDGTADEHDSSRSNRNSNSSNNNYHQRYKQMMTGFFRTARSISSWSKDEDIGGGNGKDGTAKNHRGNIDDDDDDDDALFDLRFSEPSEAHSHTLTESLYTNEKDEEAKTRKSKKHAKKGTKKKSRKKKKTGGTEEEGDPFSRSLDASDVSGSLNRSQAGLESLFSDENGGGDDEEEGEPRRPKRSKSKKRGKSKKKTKKKDEKCRYPQ